MKHVIIEHEDPVSFIENPNYKVYEVIGLKVFHGRMLIKARSREEIIKKAIFIWQKDTKESIYEEAFWSIKETNIKRIRDIDLYDIEWGGYREGRKALKYLTKDILYFSRGDNSGKKNGERLDIKYRLYMNEKPLFEGRTKHQKESVAFLLSKIKSLNLTGYLEFYRYAYEDEQAEQAREMCLSGLARDCVLFCMLWYRNHELEGLSNILSSYQTKESLEKTLGQNTFENIFAVGVLKGLGYEEGVEEGQNSLTGMLGLLSLE